ncbi:hypothetical protein [Streptomyces sp. NPDC088719]|uniref:hypothetical protein n=1 Tax=Streptomyces sp. NPDC088719 TaxID=3365872 RepID=UPI003802747A
MGWAPRPLAQLRQGALANSALRAIVDRDGEDPQVRELWHRTADLRRHAYGTIRPMHLNGWRPRPAGSGSDHPRVGGGDPLAREATPH